VIAARKKSCFVLGHTGNMDNVPLIFYVPLNMTVNTDGAKSIKIKVFGRDITYYIAILACCADGKKMSLLLIFKDERMLKDKMP
jgi:hypothetical protein